MKIRVLFLAVASSAASTAALADMFHYNNVIIGERAQGLGGAYTAIADNASGVYYNPAGLAFAQSNDISGSANAIYDRKIKFKNVFEGQDFTEKSGGTFSPFFGAMQKLDRFLKGLVGGFAYYTLDTELTDQNDVISNAVVNSTTTYDILRRTLNRKGSTTGATAGVGYRIGTDLSVGLSLSYLQTEDLTQNYLFIKQSGSLNQTASVNTREKLSSYGLEPTIGLQWAPATSLAFGLSVKKGQYASQKYESQSHYMIMGEGQFATETKSVNPIGSPPMQVRTGLAWFASPEFLMAFDLQHVAAVTDMEAGFKELNKRESVTNYHLGSEYYLSPSLPLRVGLFTNNDARKKVSNFQLESINYLGLSTFLGWAQPNSQVSLGFILQKGDGKGNKAGNEQTQTVEAFAYTIGFSATHSF